MVRRPSKKPLISKTNKKAWITFVKAHQNWTSIEWSKVLWSDESKFNLFSSNGIKYVCRPKNERYNVRYQVPTMKHNKENVMVWGGGVSRKKVGPLFRIEGNMDRFVYQEILDKQMLPYAKRNMSQSWIFQQDNDPKHSSRYVKEYFNRQKIKVLKWPS